MQEKAKEPEIRFAGFTGAWEQRKLGELSDIIGGGTPSTGNSTYWDGNINWYSPAEISNQIFLSASQRKISELGYSSCSAKILPKGTVLFTSRAGIGKTAILAEEGCTNQGFQSIVPHTNELDSYFIFSRTSELKKYGEVVGAGSTFVEVSGKQMAAMTLMMPPSINEQKVIGSFFKRLDTLLTLHQRKYEKLLNIKKSMLEKMFPKEGEVVPEIRFKGFTGAWEQRVLGDFLEVSMETNSSAKFDKNDVLSISGDYGVVNQIAFQGRSFASNSVVKYGVLHNEDIVYTKSPLKANPYGIIKTNKGKAGIVSPLYAIYHPKNNLVPSFVQSYFEQNERLNNYLRPLVNKGAKNNMLISNEKAISGKVIFPSRKEQEKISALLERVDSLLTLHQRKLEMLKNVKQAFLEKMFV